MTDTFTDDDLPPYAADDALAAEYVVGVLDLAERLAVERRIATDAPFASCVTAWENRLAGMNEAFVPAPPPADLLPRLESRLFAAKAETARPRWFGWLAGALTAAVLVLAVYAVLPARQAALLVTLATADQSLVYQAAFRGEELTVNRVSGAAAPEGQVHELWIIAPDAAPVSLGLLGAEPLNLAYPEPPAGWVLAVSVEPAGGSPTGAPTGPVILTAEIGT
jgi:anti-sigma-K factor RskA